MNIRRCRILICFIACMMLGIGISSCVQKKKAASIKVMSTILPLQEFAQAVVGNRGDAELLLPPGAEIHAWQPRPSDLMKLSSADVFIYIGAQLEPWADDILRSVQNPNLRVIEASEGITLIGHGETSEERAHDTAGEHNHEAGDPHIWLDFANDKKIIDRIAEVLSQIDPDGRAVFEENAGLYKQKLDELDEMYRKGLDQCDQKTIVLGGHAAFGYLARRYGLSQISLYGLNPDSKPTPRQLIDVIGIVKEEGIQAIFFEVNISSELARVIAEETGAETLVLNPGATLPRGQDYPGITFLGIMENNLESLKNGLRCR